MAVHALSKLNLIKNPRVFMDIYEYLFWMQCNKYCKYIGCFSRITVSCAPVPLQEPVPFAVPCAYSYKTHLKTWPYVLKLTRLFTEEMPLLIVPGVRRLPWDF